MYSSWSFIDSYLGQFFKIFTFAVLMSRDFELQRKSWSLFSWFPFYVKIFLPDILFDLDNWSYKEDLFFSWVLGKICSQSLPYSEKNSRISKIFPNLFKRCCEFYFCTQSQIICMPYDSVKKSLKIHDISEQENTGLLMHPQSTSTSCVYFHRIPPSLPSPRP